MDTNAVRASLTAELQTQWTEYIDRRIAEKVASAIAEVAEVIGSVLAKERERTHDMIKGAIAVARTETRLEIAEAKSALLEHIGIPA